MKLLPLTSDGQIDLHIGLEVNPDHANANVRLRFRVLEMPTVVGRAPVTWRNDTVETGVFDAVVE